jgi:hypothetical protein
MYYIPKSLRKKYVVMLRENLKFSLTPFCKRQGVIESKSEANLSPIGNCLNSLVPSVEMIFVLLQKKKIRNNDEHPF